LEWYFILQTFGPEYIIPKPFDNRLLSAVSAAVAEAAMRTSVAGKLFDIEEYAAKLNQSRDKLWIAFDLAAPPSLKSE
jgi:malate dehydrogenase (oxaloacetate-decarboxylating)(NADP+)